MLFLVRGEHQIESPQENLFEQSRDATLPQPAYDTKSRIELGAHWLPRNQECEFSHHHDNPALHRARVMGEVSSRKCDVFLMFMVFQSLCALIFFFASFLLEEASDQTGLARLKRTLLITLGI